MGKKNAFDGLSEMAKAGDRAAEVMPALNHWPNKPDPFLDSESEVALWLAKQPAIWAEMLQWVVRAKVRRKVVVFDRKKGLWVGAGAGTAKAQAAMRVKAMHGRHPPTQFKVKWSDEEIMTVIARAPAGTGVTAMERFVRAKLPMSATTFWRWVREMRAAGRYPRASEAAEAAVEF